MPDQQRVRNVSVYGDLEVPDIGQIVEYHHEVVIDATIAQSLIDSGNFVAVARASDDLDSPPAEPAPVTVTTPAPATPQAPASPAAEPETQEQNQ